MDSAGSFITSTGTFALSPWSQITPQGISGMPSKGFPENMSTHHKEWQGPMGWAHGSQASGVPKEALFGCFAPLAHTWLLLSLFCDDGVG